MKTRQGGEDKIDNLPFKQDKVHPDGQTTAHHRQPLNPLVYPLSVGQPTLTKGDRSSLRQVDKNYLIEGLYKVVIERNVTYTHAYRETPSKLSVV